MPVSSRTVPCSVDGLDRPAPDVGRDRAAQRRQRQDGPRQSAPNGRRAACGYPHRHIGSQRRIGRSSACRPRSRTSASASSISTGIRARPSAVGAWRTISITASAPVRAFDADLTDRDLEADARARRAAQRARLAVGRRRWPGDSLSRTTTASARRNTAPAATASIILSATHVPIRRWRS